MSRPSQLGWIALALVLLVLGLALGNTVLLTGAVFVLLSALLSIALSPPSGIVIERDLPRTASWVGDTLTVDRRVTAHRGVGLIFVHDTLPPEAELVGGSNVSVVWKWPGTKTVDIPYQLQFPKRGLFELEETRWESEAPFGVNRDTSGSKGSLVEISVVPRIRSVALLNEIRAARKSTRYRGDLAKTGATTDEFRELRPYQPGDPRKWINWKASVRAPRPDNLPLVNELEPETRKAVWIFLDVADYMDVGVPLANPLENTVEASGTLAQYYLSRGSILGAYAYNDYGGTGGLIPPESGGRQFNRLVQMLAGLKPGEPRQSLHQSVERCKGFLFRLRPDIFVITRLDVHYSRPGESTEPFERFKAAISRLTALRTHSRRFGRVRVVHVDAQPADQDLGLSRWETWLVSKELREVGAAVVEWQPAHEEFTSVLMRHIDAYR